MDKTSHKVKILYVVELDLRSKLSEFDLNLLVRATDQVIHNFTIPAMASTLLGEKQEMLAKYGRVVCDDLPQAKVHLCVNRVKLIKVST